MANDILTSARLRGLLHYDPTSGEFTHIAKRQNVIAGAVAGSDCIDGYRKHKIDGRTYRAHRLAWLYVNGSWPKGEIDHINGVRNDNRICNLRDVPRGTNSENQRNPRKNNKSGLLGVIYPFGWDKKFRAVISIGGKSVSVGRFDTAEAAHEAYLIKKRSAHAGCTI